ncbi:MAG: hypothetical protein C4536_15555 [Actinobacteria bacterium]|jgi:hypothetical protein|nr:MAG: hypothetical protein C4536_15555 [Actinomycetota bacterium]
MRRPWSLTIVSLTVLLSLLVPGCQNSKRGVVMVDCKDERIKVGYHSGFNSGASEGYGEASRGESYSPSLKKNLNGGFIYSSGYWRGFNEGYDYGWKTAQKGGSRSEYDWYHQAVAELKRPGEQAVIGYDLKEDDYQRGYAGGYNVGRKEAQAGSGFDTPQSSTVDRYCSGETQRYIEGWIAGYKDGYRDNQKAVDSKPYTEQSDYDYGFQEGYKKGYTNGELDKKADYGYLPEINLYDLIGSEERQRGFKDGYDKGYKEGYGEVDPGS